MRNMRDHVNVIDPDGNVLWSHHGPSGIVNHPRGTKCWKVFEGREARCPHCVHPQIFEDGKPRDYEAVSGKRRWWVRAAPLLDRRGRIRAIIEIATDITALRKLETEQRELESELLQTRQREALAMMAGGLAHTINNRLMTIQGFSELIAEDAPDTGDIRDYADTIRSECRQAAQVCRQMLDYAGKGQTRREPVDLRDVVSMVCERVQSHKELPVKITYHVPDAGMVVEGDEAQLRQMLRNLVDNAIEATAKRDDGLVDVSVRPAGSLDAPPDNARFLSRFIPGEHIMLSVSDNGTGMDTAGMERIFTPYYTTHQHGRGLGLAAVEGILRSYQGGIAVESGEGRGTLVTVYLPASPPWASGESPPDTVTRPDNTDANTILLVEDEQEIRTVVKAMLHRGGYDVLMTDSGKEAKWVFAQNADRIACVLLDMQLPDCSGQEVIEVLRALQPDVRILVQSGYSEAVANSSLTLDERTAYISKPYSGDALLSTIQELLGHTASDPIPPSA